MFVFVFVKNVGNNICKFYYINWILKIFGFNFLSGILIYIYSFFFKGGNLLKLWVNFEYF